MDITLDAGIFRQNILNFLPPEYTYIEDQTSRDFTVVVGENGATFWHKSDITVVCVYSRFATRDEAFQNFATEMVAYLEEFNNFMRSH